MAFWYRMKQLQLKTLSNHLKRCYFQTQAPCSLNNNSPHTKIWVVDSPSWFLHKTQFQIANNVRFFAAPVQVKPKPEDKDSTGPRLNEQITSQYVRLVTDEGHGIVSRHEALERARTLKLDLVEVQRTAKPPVCKIMDYHKEKYVQQIKEKDRSKSKSEVTLRKGDCKEVRFTGKIEQKDLQMKADMVKRLMERGYRVKCMAMGTEDQDLGGLLSRLSALIDDFCIVESGPRVEKKQAYVIVRHVKFGPSKKGSSKKATSSTKVPKVSVSPQIINPSAQIPLQFDEISDEAESGLETEDDILYEEAATSPSFKTLDEDLVENKSTWSVSNASDDFDKVFDFRNDVASPEMPSSPANSFSKVSSMIPTLDFTITPLNSPSSAEAPLGIDNRYKREPRNKMNVNGPDMRDSATLKPQFPNPRGHLQFDLSTSSPSRETKHVEMEGSMFKNVKLPADQFPKRGPSQSPSPSFGLFTAPEPNSINGKQSGPAVVVNRYKKTANPSRNTESHAKVQR